MTDLKKDFSGIRLLIFDLDGTLADTMNGIVDGVNMVMEKYNAPAHTYEEIRSFVGNGFRVLIARALPPSLSADENIIDEAAAYFEHSCYTVTCNNRTRCYDGMMDSLKTLKSRGYTLAVLSNKKDVFVKPMIRNMFPEGLVSVAMGQRDEFPRKPDPTVSLTIARQLGFEPCETAFIGDSNVDVFTGKNSGMITVGCTWGYRERRELEEAGADVLIDRPSELVELFGQIG